MVVSITAGDNRSRTETDLGRFGKTAVVLKDGRGWSDVTGGAVTELAGEQLREVRLSLALFGDWRRDVGGRRVPHRTVTTTQEAGRTIFEVEQVETGVKMDSGIQGKPNSTRKPRPGQLALTACWLEGLPMPTTDL